MQQSERVDAHGVTVLTRTWPGDGARGHRGRCVVRWPQRHLPG